MNDMVGMHQLDRIEKMLIELTDNDATKYQKVNTQRLVIEMLSYMATEKRIEAIKLCRQICEIGLKEAKDLVCNAQGNR